MLVVHHLNNSRSHRLLVLLEELGVPYEVKLHKRLPSGFAPPELKRIHPLGKAPILVDGERVLVETGAIIEDVLDTHGEGRLRPAGGDDLFRYRQYLHYAEGSLMPLLLLSLVFTGAARQAPAIGRPLVKAVSKGAHAKFITPNLRLQLGFLEGELSRRPWFAGEAFSAADVQMSFPLEAAEARGLLARHPRLLDWIARFRSRPSYARAIERGGKQDFVIG